MGRALDLRTGSLEEPHLRYDNHRDWGPTIRDTDTATASFLSPAPTEPPAAERRTGRRRGTPGAGRRRGRPPPAGSALPDATPACAWAPDRVRTSSSWRFCAVGFLFGWSSRS